jgi:hypothetical protein
MSRSSNPSRSTSINANIVKETSGADGDGDLDVFVNALGGGLKARQARVYPAAPRADWHYLQQPLG